MKEDRAWRDYSQRFRRDVLPMLLSSAVSLSIYSGDGTDFDVKQATELGAALLLGKPLLFVCTRGAVLPDGLRRAADEIVEGWDPESAEDQERLRTALLRVTGRAS